MLILPGMLLIALSSFPGHSDCRFGLACAALRYTGRLARAEYYAHQ